MEAAAVDDRLRVWARGNYSLEAGVELLIRGGKAVYDGAPWIRTEHGVTYIDVAELVDEAGAWSGGERRLVEIAASLIDDERVVNLSEVITGIDRRSLELVLASLAHANGSHEHSDFVVSEDGATCSTTRLGPLFPWPGSP